MFSLGSIPVMKNAYKQSISKACDRIVCIQSALGFRMASYFPFCEDTLLKCVIIKLHVGPMI